jgi:peptide chain release factor subunit 1
MASTVSLETLRELAGFRADEGVAVSLYLDLDPSLTPTAGDAATRVRSLLAQAGKHLDRGELTHDQRKSLRGDIERIRSWFENDLDRDGAHGVAVFASGLDNLWRALSLAEPVTDAVKVNTELFITPLVPVVARGDGTLVAVVGRKRGELFRLRAGRLEEIADRTEDAPGRHEQGGRSQARYQRHIENVVHSHLRHVADELERSVRGGLPRVVVVAAEETRAAFEAMLSKEVEACVIGWTTAEAHAGPTELLSTAAPILEEWRARREADVLDRWRAEAGSHGRAAVGWAPTLEAASDGRVAMLLYASGADHSAWRCPSCGRLRRAGRVPWTGRGWSRPATGSTSRCTSRSPTAARSAP